MDDWTSGYVADINYTYGYYAELNPLRFRLPFLSAGLVPPKVMTACELGFGQGVSINVHAAASTTSWWGTDFNPAQAGFAQELAGVSKADVHVFDEAFAEFCARTDLPDFDFIGLHGIWSWISDENRARVVDFIRRKLKVGGVLYNSYNTQPGWAAMIPMRDLLTQHAEVMGAPGSGTVARVDSALDFAEKLLALNPRFVAANPSVKDRLQKIKGQNRNYLAHEYFNRDWKPMPFADFAKWIAPAKMSYACSANPLEQFESLNFSKEQVEFLKQIPDPLFQQSVRDFMTNEQFRRDFWVKGPRRVSDTARSEMLRELRVVLTTPRKEVNLKLKGLSLEADMSPHVYDPLLDFLADHKPHSLRDLEKVAGRSANMAGIAQAALALTAKGVLSIANDDEVAAKAKNTSDRLNRHLLDLAKGSADIAYMASPILGGGFRLERTQQLFLLSMRQGGKKPSDWAKYAWEIFKPQGIRLLKDGKTLQSEADNLTAMEGLAERFGTQQAPVLKALQIA